MEVEFIMYDPYMTYFNLKIVFFIDMLNWIFNDYFVQVNKNQKPREETGLCLLWAKPRRPKEIRLTKKSEISLGAQTYTWDFPWIIGVFTCLFLFFEW